MNDEIFNIFRTCYIAPERFVKTLSSELNNTLLLPEQEVKTGDLHPMMDIFSAGCALTELYNEGHPPFDFSQLLGIYDILFSYRTGFRYQKNILSAFKLQKLFFFFLKLDILNIEIVSKVSKKFYEDC